MQAACSGSREVEIPITEKRIIRSMQKRATDILSENAPIFILLNKMLTKARLQLPITRMRAHADNAPLAVCGLAFLE
jgi:hypothetical protein